MHLDTKLLATAFADASQFCGHEAVIQAILHYRLNESAAPGTRIVREYALSGGKADVVVLGPSAGKAGGSTLVPRIAIEVKGGANAHRNALKVNIRSTGFCDDMAKLRPEAAKGVECWFVCLDMPELGRAVGPLLAELIAEQCVAHGLNFAYHCQGEAFWLIAGPGRPLARMPLVPVSGAARPGGIDFLLDSKAEHLLPLAKALLGAPGDEANLASTLYNTLRANGFGVEQLSLETYFSFAAEQDSRMQLRPDMTVFDSSFDGRFNLYAGGNRQRSNDAHKLAHLEAIIEIKGSAAMCRKPHKGVLADYLKDVDKLADWRGKIAAHSGMRPRALFIGVDARTESLPEAARDEVIERCKRAGVSFLLVNRNNAQVWRA